MKTVGLTGGIGAGKSYVAELLLKKGYPVYHSDGRAKQLMIEEPELVLKIKSIFGKKAYNGKALNRKYLAERIFHDVKLKDKLNQIVHPAVRQDFEKWKHQQNTLFVFNEAAILFETGGYKNVDFTLLVTAPEKVRINRVMKRDNATEEEVKNRISNQWTESKKEMLADFTLKNDGKLDVEAQLVKILIQLEEINH